MSAPLNRPKLAKVLALLASPQDGEALNAARMAVRMLAAADMRPEQLAEARNEDADLLNMLALSVADQADEIDRLKAKLTAAEADRDEYRNRWINTGRMERDYSLMRTERDYARERNAELREELARVKADLENHLSSAVDTSSHPSSDVDRCNPLARIRALLEENPARSDRAIAREAGCSPTTVGKLRKEAGLTAAVRSVQRKGTVYAMKADTSCNV